MDNDNANEFDEPPVGGAAEEERDAEETDEDMWEEEEEEEEVEAEWEEPLTGAGEGAGEEAVEAETVSAELDDFGEGILDIHNEVTAIMEQQVTDLSAAGAIETEATYEEMGNIVGVGLGIAGTEGDLDGGLPGDPCLNLYVAEPWSSDDARAVLADSMSVSAAANSDVPINVIVTGPIDAQPHRFRIRPAPGGVSVGHIKITCGTLGCLARGSSGTRRRRLLILSNNHVLAASNRGRWLDPIVQPGRCDGGRSPRDRVAVLERFVPINFAGRPNLVDCATAWAWPRLVRREMIYRSGGRFRFFRVGSRPVRCRRGMLVAKSGRTTQLTRGRITDCSATIRVNYRPRVALFRDQIAIRGLRGSMFSRGGDSGSLIWTLDRRRSPVGLLFAGGGGFTFGNKIGHVLRALRIQLVT